MRHSNEKYELAIKTFKDGHTLKSVSELYDIPLETLRCHFYRHNIIEKYRVNHSVFKVIDSEAKAYWLGYIFGDGSISNQNRLTLSSKDLDHLEKFRQFLGSNHKIGNDSISLTSRKIVSDLISHGVEVRKQFSDSIKFPNIAPELKRHFIRGLIDSDGWVGKSKNIGVCGKSKILLDGINNEIVSAIGVIGVICHRTNHWGSVYTLDFKTSNFKELYSHLYLDSTIFLNRKKAIADKLYQNLKEPKYIWVKKHRKKEYFVFQKGGFRKQFNTLSEAENFRDDYLLGVGNS